MFFGTETLLLPAVIMVLRFDCSFSEPSTGRTITSHEQRKNDTSANFAISFVHGAAAPMAVSAIDTALVIAAILAEVPTDFKPDFAFLILVPEVKVRLLPASIFTFLPRILMSPFGASMVMPVKAEMFTLPNGLFTFMERVLAERSSSYTPLGSRSVMPPVNGAQFSSIARESVFPHHCLPMP